MKRCQQLKKQPGAVVIGGDYRGLGVVRSLGRRGIPVWVMCDTHTLAAYSRYACNSIPWPEGDEARQTAFLIHLAQNLGLAGWTLFPTGDETTTLIARNHNQLSDYFRLTCLTWNVIRKLTDKRQLYQLSAQIGIPHPWTFYPHSRDDLVQLECNFPVILKPAERIGFNPFVREKAWKVSNTDELLRRYEEACRYMPPDQVLIQEWIPGGGEDQFSYAALYQDGRPLAEVSVKRTRQYPQDFGRFSTFVESIEQPELEAYARQLLVALNFTGLIELEFKRDPRNNLFKLLDANPRVWGWHTLGNRAGIDFSYLQWQLANGGQVSVLRGQVGVKWVRMLFDLMVAIKDIRSGKQTPWQYLASLRGPIEFAIFALDDPLPGFVELPLLLRLAFKRKGL